jgi:hypothetical protein
MNQDTGTAAEADGFDILEEKVLRAVALIQRLKAEHASLIEARAGREAPPGAGSSVPDESMRDLAGRLAELEKEKAQWVREKRDLTRRVEDIVAKLEFLEAEAVQPG